MKAAFFTLCVTGSITFLLGRIGYNNPMLWLAGLQFLVAGLIHVLRERPADEG